MKDKATLGPDQVPGIIKNIDVPQEVLDAENKVWDFMARNNIQAVGHLQLRGSSDSKDLCLKDISGVSTARPLTLNDVLLAWTGQCEGEVSASMIAGQMLRNAEGYKDRLNAMNCRILS